METRYTGKAWKHHISENFENGKNPVHPNGAGPGATIFLDYEMMKEYLINDGRKWHIAELDLREDIIIYEFNCDWMVTIKNGRWSQEGFKPFIHDVFGTLKPFKYD